MIVADTDVLIDVLNGKAPFAELFRGFLSSGPVWTTAISRFEVLAGARTVDREKEARELLDGLGLLSLDLGAADRAAEIQRQLVSRGETLGTPDCLIAGIVLANGGELLTRNRKHFARIPGLALAAWPGKEA